MCLKVSGAGGNLPSGLLTNQGKHEFWAAERSSLYFLGKPVESWLENCFEISLPSSFSVARRLLGVLARGPGESQWGRPELSMAPGTPGDVQLLVGR